MGLLLFANQEVCRVWLAQYTSGRRSLSESGACMHDLLGLGALTIDFHLGLGALKV